MALLDQTLDETVSISDSFVVSATYDIELFDFVAVTPTFATVYEFTLLDSLVVLDSMSAARDRHLTIDDNITTKDTLGNQMSFDVLVADALVAPDKVYAGLEKAVVALDAAVVSDSTTPGLERHLDVSDTVSTSDQSTTGRELAVAVLDTLSPSDQAFSWMNGLLTVNIEGRASGSATLIQRGPRTITLANIPSRTQVLPKPPLEHIYHNVLNTSPVHRRG